MELAPLFLKNIGGTLFGITPDLKDFTFHKPVSTNVFCLAFNRQEKKVFAVFNSRALYLYENVPDDVFIEYDPKSSAGSFVINFLHPHKECRKITTTEEYSFFPPDPDHIVAFVTAANKMSSEYFELKKVIYAMEIQNEDEGYQTTEKSEGGVN